MLGNPYLHSALRFKRWLDQGPPKIENYRLKPVTFIVDLAAFLLRCRALLCQTLLFRGIWTEWAVRGSLPCSRMFGLFWKLDVMCQLRDRLPYASLTRQFVAVLCFFPARFYKLPYMYFLYTYCPCLPTPPTQPLRCWYVLFMLIWVSIALSCTQHGFIVQNPVTKSEVWSISSPPKKHWSQKKKNM